MKCLVVLRKQEKLNTKIGVAMHAGTGILVLGIPVGGMVQIEKIKQQDKKLSTLLV